MSDLNLHIEVNHPAYLIETDINGNETERTELTIDTVARCLAAILHQVLAPGRLNEIIAEIEAQNDSVD